ncbi:MAG: hypothetical protein ABL998_21600, partial [Planctomycetota bacterium]
MSNNELFARVLSWLLTYAVHSSVLLGAVWLLLRFLPPRGLVLRERLWKLALVGPLVTASLQLALGARPWLGHLEWVATPVERVAELEPRALTEPQGELETTQAEPRIDAPAAPRSSEARRSPPRRERRPVTKGPRLAELPETAADATELARAALEQHVSADEPVEPRT